MRHRCKKRRMNRPADQRKAALRALATSVIRDKEINTTLANAKAVVPEVEKIITLAKRGDLHARRQALAFVYDKDAVKELFGTIAERYKDRSSGFTRVIKSGYRRGDNAALALLQLV